MRLRALATAAACGLAVLFAAAPSASAAEGYFVYLYNDPASGDSIPVLLVDPPSGECVTLPEVADPATEPAHSPRNDTASTATVFTGSDCTGDYFSLRPNGGHASERLKLRSVVFS
ncbi:hypothetical protein Q5762_03925 [Streptomyces sp. P9(2023)]|uniref:hypothetical protein n=1 Tax=Streptomyces sp. P9(2023) TaxID=3064394 RepID=UPI0028F3F2F0|nr:hypothetical protein [Streptomyces sp. P9(2023)]MDT9687503.1 hypothetical protein [Streptomyces sp. P9(2023)]